MRSWLKLVTGQGIRGNEFEVRKPGVSPWPARLPSRDWGHMEKIPGLHQGRGAIDAVSGQVWLPGAGGGSGGGVDKGHGQTHF